MRRLAILRHHDLHALDSPTDPFRPAQTRVMKTAPRQSKTSLHPWATKQALRSKVRPKAEGINLYGGKKHTVATASGSV